MPTKTITPIADVLQEATTYLERGWCQGTAARDHCGNPVAALAPNAASWCALGALFRARSGRTIRHDSAVLIEDELSARGYGGDIEDWNDEPGRRASEVIELFQAAARRAS